jgi:predicted heme/steroid binding protein
MKKKTLKWWLVKIDRFSAWVLLATMFLYFLSGYGMTKGIIDARFSNLLHTNILPFVIMISFAIHTFLSVRLSFKRWRIWNTFTFILLIIIYSAFLIGFGYVELFYKNANVREETAIEQTTTTTETVTTSQESSSTESQERVFTREELVKYNGKNGTPPYVAVDGVVYDMTGVFVNGRHFFHTAGEDLTDAFYMEHMKSQITKYPVVGKLE